MIMNNMQQYYVAVDRQQYKMGTVVDLVEILGRKDGLPLCICCSSRDALDAVLTSFSPSPRRALSFLHSDLSEAECTLRFEEFRKAVAAWNQNVDIISDRDIKGETQDPYAHLIVVTDACLPSQAIGEAPLGARVLINYDLPLKKEAYHRRLFACFGHTAASTAGGIVINMVVGGEVSLLRNIEEVCGIVIDEMPINIFELL